MSEENTQDTQEAAAEPTTEYISPEITRDVQTEPEPGEPGQDDGEEGGGGPADDTAPETEGKEKDSRKFKPSRVHQIERLKSQREALRAENKRLEAELASMYNPNPGAQMAAPMPDVEDYPTYEAYVDAVVQHRVREHLLQAVPQMDGMKTQQRIQHNAASEKQALVQEFGLRFGEYAAGNAGAVEAIKNIESLPLATSLLSEMLSSDMGPQLVHHLGTHPDEAARLSELSQVSPPSAIRELGRLEAKLASMAVKPPSARTVTNSPEPVRGVKPGASSRGRDPSRMSQAEYNAWREKTGRRPKF